MHLALLIASLYLLRPSLATNFECAVHDRERIECGYLGIAREECIRRGCCWKESHSPYPWCFSKRAAIQCIYYEIEHISLEESTVRAALRLNNTLCPKDVAVANNINQLIFEASFDNENQVRIQIKDKENECWQIPTELVPICNQTPVGRGATQRSCPTNANANFWIEQQQDQLTITHSWYQTFLLIISAKRFNFKLVRIQDGECIFDTFAHENSLIFQKFYKKIGTFLPVDVNIYGFGENVAPFCKNTRNSTFTLFNQDSPTFPHVNLYGSHAFYLGHRLGKSHGVFLRNSNGMDIILRNNQLQYKVIGGIFDLFFFAGPTPHDVIRQYTDVVGKPFFIPYWSLGFHQCRYGYKNIAEINDVIDSFRKHQIPLETMWMDIDYMNGFENFSFDLNNFPEVQVRQLVDRLHANGQRFIPIIDPGIKVRPKSKPYESGMARGIFVKSSSGKPFHGRVWPGLTHFPDFLHPETEHFWEESLVDFYQKCKFDGLWLDMNEISNFCNGECTDPDSGGPLKDKPQSFENTFIENPPYVINNAGVGAPLNTKTVDMSCLHNGNILEYNVHNLYGLLEAKTTNKVLQQIHRGKRPFIISRSTFAGSGAYCGHWTGDNFSDWKSLASSISSILTFQLFGIPMVGADICGFIGDSTEELCARWMQLGSVYPFSRNHNSIQSAPQEPYRFPIVAAISRKYLNLRYSLLPYFYFLFFTSHKTGDCVWRPLFFEFPSDSNTFAIEGQFMLGPALLISPCLSQGATTVQAYFPQGIWYPVETAGVLVQNELMGSYFSLDTPLDYMPIHLRGGHIIPTQNPAATTQQVKASPMTFLIGLSEKNEASGSFYDDDGDSITVDKFTLLRIKATLLDAQLLDIHFEGQAKYVPPMMLRKLQVFCSSTEFKPKMAFINDQSIACRIEHPQPYKITIELVQPVELRDDTTILIH